MRDVFTEKKKEAWALLLAGSPGWLLKCQISWSTISPKAAVFVCTEAGQAIHREIIKEQKVILLTESDKANYTITMDRKRWEKKSALPLQKLPKEASVMKQKQQIRTVAISMRGAFNNAFIVLELQYDPFDDLFIISPPQH